MRSGDIPLQFDISDVLKKLRRAGKSRVGNVSLSLPFVSIAVSPKSREKQVAREVVIRLKDVWTAGHRSRTPRCAEAMS